MLSVIFIIFVGKFFADHAANYDKSRWLFAIIGIVTYYAGTFIGGILIGLIQNAVSGPVFYRSYEENGWKYLAIPIGLLFCVGLYFILKSSWESERKHKQVSEENSEEDVLS